MHSKRCEGSEDRSEDDCDRQLDGHMSWAHQTLCVWSRTPAGRHLPRPFIIRPLFHVRQAVSGDKTSQDDCQI